MRNLLVLIHFHPLELYPPVMNMLEYLGNNQTEKLRVITHSTNKIKNNYQHPKISIKRLDTFEISQTIKRQIRYLGFIIKTFLYLLKTRPTTIFYYETNSALPVFLYLKLIGTKKTKLFIHYHEYNTPEQYKVNMKFVYLSYLVEKKWLWIKANWISHTNNHRVDLFKKDYPFVNNLTTLPNYPPAQWANTKIRKTKISDSVTRLVYIGSLSMVNFHIKSVCNWIITHKQNVTLTIYTHNSTTDLKKYLDSLNSNKITINYTGIWYYTLPNILKEYDVGLILYKGFSQNYIYNETNKLFEYLACGLDVWFSEETKGIYRHITENTWPKVVKLDYNRLDKYSLEELIDHEGLTYKPSEFYCEEVYEGFVRKLKGESKKAESE